MVFGRIPEGGDNAWDAAHAQVADQLGVDESDVIFAEPDLQQQYPDVNERNPQFALGPTANPTPRIGRREGRRSGFRLASARRFLAAWPGARRGGIHQSAHAHRHIDTGYDKTHNARPENILTDLEHNSWMRRQSEQLAGSEPPRHVDNSGHGTGTSGILAAGRWLCQRQLSGRLPARRDPAHPHSPTPCDVLQPAIRQGDSSTPSAALRRGLHQHGGLPSSAWNEADEPTLTNGHLHRWPRPASASPVCLATTWCIRRAITPIAACRRHGPTDDRTTTCPQIIEEVGAGRSMDKALALVHAEHPVGAHRLPDTIDPTARAHRRQPADRRAVALWYEKSRTCCRALAASGSGARALFRSGQEAGSTHL